MTRKGILDLAAEKVVVVDGAMGTMIQRRKLDAADFGGIEGCNEILVETRPDVIREIHSEYLKAGCDAVETNTFGANGLVLSEYGLGGRVEELNRKAAALARDVATGFSAGAPRYVIGSVGPGTRLPSLGQISFDDLRAAYLPQVLGLIRGGVDALCIETCQDLLQVKAALDAAAEAFRIDGRRVPTIVSVTIESSGTMLVGSDIQTVAASLLPMGVDVLGLNCATGPAQMKRHIQQLSAYGPSRLLAMPNAGLPENVGGELVYRLTPVQFADWVEGFVREDGIGLVGGCCGTTPEHLAELAARVGALPAPERTPCRQAEVSSLFQAVPLRQVPPPCLIGERTNANGSKEFRERLICGDVDGMLSVASEQQDGGAHILDVSVAYTGRNEKEDMLGFLSRLVPFSRAPISVDSTDPDVVEAALKLCGGRCVINSINLEDGTGRFDRIAQLAGRFGAAVIALVIDEQGMAMTTERKLSVAERILDRCLRVHGLAPQDLIFDMLTFTVAGDLDTRHAAVETLEAIRTFKKRCPETQTVLGVSNVSFGLKPSARRVLNSGFLALAVEAGLDLAIVNARGILPLHKIPSQLFEAASRLLLDDRSQGDPLSEFLALFQGQERTVEAGDAEAEEQLPPEDALRRMVIDGRSTRLTSALQTLLANGRPPMGVINDVLIPAMQHVGELFGSGRTQLPFVLRSAEVMKTAVAHLEEHFQGARRDHFGTLVLATVKGDVHDIGKNLVEIIVSNNGHRVVDLGTKVEIDRMVAAIQEHRPLALGMSGLLVKSTVVMKENLDELKRRGISVPVLLGGAALTRDFVERDLRAIYGQHVYYCPDAFAGLAALERIAHSGSPGGGAAELIANPRSPGGGAPELIANPRSPGGGALEEQKGRSGQSQGRRPAGAKSDRRSAARTNRQSKIGNRKSLSLPLDELFALVNETSLVSGHWHYKKGKLTLEQYQGLMADEVKPALHDLKLRCIDQGILRPRAVYGFWQCFSRGDGVVLLDEKGSEVETFRFPRKKSPPHNCIADYIRPESFPPPDIIGAFVVTVGGAASAEAGRLYRENRYLDYLRLHGLAVETAEAAAEWMHSAMLRELGFRPDDSADPSVAAGRRLPGFRYSFGYPACPNLEDQGKLFRLLDPAEIGVSLTESWEMVPEFSVSAIVVQNPNARHFDLD